MFNVKISFGQPILYLPNRQVVQKVNVEPCKPLSSSSSSDITKLEVVDVDAGRIIMLREMVVLEVAMKF
jgi:hypothetical protein